MKKFYDPGTNTAGGVGAPEVPAETPNEAGTTTTTTTTTTENPAPQEPGASDAAE